MIIRILQAVRSLRRTPTATLMCIVILTLGIGATTAIFSVINAALLRPISGVREPGSLALLQRVQDGQLLGNFGYPDYLEYRRQVRSFSGIAAVGSAPLNYTHAETTERLRGAIVSGDYFNILGVVPAAGRLLEMNDERNAADNAVLSYGLWQRDFAADPAILGRTIQLNGHGFVVVGVAANTFMGATIGISTDIWLPIITQPIALPYMSAGILQNRAAGWLTLFGRLKNGVRREQAESELIAIASGLAEAHPDTNAHRTLRLFQGVGMDPDTKDQLEQLLGLLFGSVVLLLLIACGNVSGLLLARGAARRREIAIRTALGASGTNLLTQLLAEASVLAIAACGAGLVFAAYASEIIVKWQPNTYGLQNLDVAIDARVFAFAAFAALLTTIPCTLMPAWQMFKLDLGPSLKEGARGSGRYTTMIRSALVIGQVAISIVLLIAAGLVIRTMHRALVSDQGFETDRIVLLSLDVTTNGYSPDRGLAFYDQLLPWIQSVPGVAAASLAGTVPPSDLSGRRAIFYPGQQPADIQGHEFDPGNLRVDSNSVGPGYLRTMGIALLRGRDFTPQDRHGSTPVAIVNQRLAQLLWPGEDAIGKSIAVPEFSGIDDPDVEVIGVASDSKYRSLLEAPQPLLYLPVMQRYGGRIVLTVRTAGDPAALIPQLVRKVQSLDPTVSLYGIETMPDHIAASLWQQHIASSLIGLFGVLAAILAAVGLYGIIAHGVAERTREIGIRRALGAQNTDIQRLILKQGFGMVFGGIALGVIAASGLTRFISPLLYGISPYDSATFIGVSVLFCVVAFLASEIPAQRAARIDPTTALRHD